MRRAALLWIGALFSVVVEAGPIHWVPSGPPGSPSITALATAHANFALGFRPPANIFAGVAGGGVLRSDFSGQFWTSTGSGLEGHDPVALAVSQVSFQGIDSTRYDTTIYAATAGAGVFRLAPDATTWVAANTGLTSLDVKALAVSGDGVVASPNATPVLYAGTAGGLFASADGGNTWVAKTAGLSSGPDGAITALGPDPSAPATLYAGTPAGLFKSTDGAGTWTKLDAGSPYKFAASALAVDPLVPSRVYAAGIASPPCAPLCAAPSFLTALRSVDGGASWSTMSGLTSNLVQAFAATASLPTAVFAGTSGGGVFQSPDGGATWAAASDGLATASVSSLVIDQVLPSLVFAGTALGVFRTPLGQAAATCPSGGQALCLASRRFGVSVVWRDSNQAAHPGQPLTITDTTSAFWFFDPTNIELVVKVIDGRSVNGKFWVISGALSNVEYTITVTDTLTGAVRTYFNPEGRLASIADTAAF